MRRPHFLGSLEHPCLNCKIDSSRNCLTLKAPESSCHINLEKCAISQRSRAIPQLLHELLPHVEHGCQNLTYENN
jgi:hypothetical protein